MATKGGCFEQTMIGVAAGLALRGRIPIVHALASFLTMRAFEFIRTDVGIPALPIKLVGGFSGFQHLRVTWRKRVPVFHRWRRVNIPDVIRSGILQNGLKPLYPHDGSQPRDFRSG